MAFKTARITLDALRLNTSVTVDITQFRFLKLLASPAGSTLQIKPIPPEGAVGEFFPLADLKWMRTRGDLYPNLQIMADTTGDYDFVYSDVDELRGDDASILALGNVQVQGPVAINDARLLLSDFDKPLMPGMIFDSSYMGLGPYVMRPFQTLSQNGLWVETPDNSEGFNQSLQPNVPVTRDVRVYGSVRINQTVGASTGTIAFTDQQGAPIPLWRLSTNAIILTGLIPNGVADVFYAPLNGVGLMQMTLDILALAPCNVHLGLSPRPCPFF